MVECYEVTRDMLFRFFFFFFFIKVCMAKLNLFLPLREVVQAVVIYSTLFLFIYLFIYLFMAVLGLRFCVRAFSSCGERGPLFIAVHGPITVAASPIAEHRLQTRRLSSCGSRA